MTWIEFLFLFFGLITVVAAIGILFTKSVIHAAMLLIVVLLSLASIYVLFNAELLAVVQVLIYAGGIVVLLAFGVMLSRRDKDGKIQSGRQLLVPAVLLGAFLIVLLFQVIEGVDLPKQITKSDQSGQIESVGVSFMTENLLAFELIAFLLLVVLVGAAFVAKKQTEVD